MKMIDNAIIPINAIMIYVSFIEQLLQTKPG
jgi:hypothetical protein